MSRENVQLLLSKMKSLYKDAAAEIRKELMLEASGMIYAEVFEDKVRECLYSDEDIASLLKSFTNQSEKIPTTDEDVWIFGYGSLIWKADFPFIDRQPGFIIGYQRRFFQNSIDHRGTHSKPGRVVTLVPTQKHEDRVYGMAYRIASKHKDDVLQRLDYREKNGYERCVLQFNEFPESKGISFDVTMYIATAENESYAGDISDLQLIADQIFTSAGPSGPNREYLLHLAKAMRSLFPGVEDTHLFELETEVLKRVRYKEPSILKSALMEKIEKILIDKLEKFDEERKDNDACIEDIEKGIFSLRNHLEQPGWKESLLQQKYNSKN